MKLVKQVQQLQQNKTASKHMYADLTPQMTKYNQNQEMHLS